MPSASKPNQPRPQSKHPQHGAPSGTGAAQAGGDQWDELIKKIEMPASKSGDRLAFRLNGQNELFRDKAYARINALNNAADRYEQQKRNAKGDKQWDLSMKAQARRMAAERLESLIPKQDPQVAVADHVH